MNETLVYEDDERRVWYWESGPEGTPGRTTSYRIERKTLTGPEQERLEEQARLDAVATKVLPPDDPTEKANYDAIEQAITDALVRLQQLVDAPALPAVPAGTMNTQTLSDVVRALRDQAQQTRAGAQEVALTLKRTIRLVRGDYSGTA